MELQYVVPNSTQMKSSIFTSMFGHIPFWVNIGSRLMFLHFRLCNLVLFLFADYLAFPTVWTKVCGQCDTRSMVSNFVGRVWRRSLACWCKSLAWKPWPNPVKHLLDKQEQGWSPGSINSLCIFVVCRMSDAGKIENIIANDETTYFRQHIYDNYLLLRTIYICDLFIVWLLFIYKFRPKYIETFSHHFAHLQIETSYEVYCRLKCKTISFCNWDDPTDVDNNLDCYCSLTIVRSEANGWHLTLPLTNITKLEHIDFFPRIDT